MSPSRILIVDDEAIVRTSCRRVLEPVGYEVTDAADAAEGLRLLEERAFDLVLTDLKMPGMDGIEFLEQVKTRWPGIQVIVVTGYQTIDTAVRAIKLGAFDYVNKPFSPEQLRAVAARALAEKSGG